MATSIEFHADREPWNLSRPIISKGKMYILEGRGRPINRRLSAVEERHLTSPYPAGKFWVAFLNAVLRNGDIRKAVCCTCYKYSKNRGLLVLRDIEFLVSHDRHNNNGKQCWLQDCADTGLLQQLPYLLRKELVGELPKNIS